MPEIKTETVVEQETVTDLKIISNVQEFTWNFAEVKKTIEGNIQKYVGLVVTEENLKEMETAQKEIASIRTKVDGFRKAVKKKMEEPYKVFEGEIKELLQLIEKAETPLKEQTLKYEQDRIAIKEDELKKFAQKTATNMGVRPEYFKIVIPSTWTNRTAKQAAVRKEIVKAIETMLDAQRRDDEAAEMAKQRAGLIESQCLTHSVALKTPVVPEDVNHLLVGVALPDISGIILAECQKRAEMEAKAAAVVPSIEPVTPPQNNERFELGISFPDNGIEDDLNRDDGIYIGFASTSNPIPRELATFVEVKEPAVFPPYPSPLSDPGPRPTTPMPPLPPMPPFNNVQPPQPQLFNCVIEFPNITAQEGAAIKEFISSRAISYKIISQVAVGSAF